MHSRRLLSICVTMLSFSLLCSGMTSRDAVAAEILTGLEGKIMKSPVHGGPATQGISDAAPVAKAAFEVKSPESTVASFITDEQGHFRIELPPGRYFVEMKGIRQRKVGFYGPFEVKVRAGEITKVSWMCNTGLL
jgi:hypothetical protein